MKEKVQMFDEYIAQFFRYSSITSHCRRLVVNITNAKRTEVHTYFA